MDDLHYATLTEAGAALRDGDITAVALTGQLLRRIESLDGALNSYITVTADHALAQAHRADAELREGRDRGPLHGIPMAIKDLIPTNGILTTGGSLVFENWIPDYDAAVIRKLDQAGAIMLGKTGLHELAFGSTSINPYFGAIANPWKLDHHSGGSSGGSAVAVAAGMALAGIGTDTGCSVRQPAQCCGIVGHKPTFGLVSKAGVLPLVDSMDHVGPLTRTVRDAALVLQAIAGHDSDDPHCVDRPVPDFVEKLDRPIDGAVIGVPRAFFYENGDDEVCEIVSASLEVFELLGARAEDIEIADIDAAYRAGDVTFVEIVESNGEAMRRDPSLFSEEFTQRYNGVARSTPADYAQAQDFRERFRAQLDTLLETYSVLVVPTSTIAAASMTVQVLALVLLAACIHATWNTWLKLSGDRLVVMALMGAGWALLAACWLPFLEPVHRDAWPYLAVSVVVHLAYTLLLVPAYRLVDLSVAYPMIRGSGPVLVTLASLFVLGEAVGLLGWAAVLLITGGVLALGWGGATGNYRALLFGVLCGALLAAYTFIDGVGARISGAALTYSAWLFFLSGLPLLIIGFLVRRGEFIRLARPIALRGLLAGAIASVAFAIVIWSMTRAPLGLVAAARETSVVMVAIAGAVLLKERVNWMAIGAVFIGVVLLRFAAN